MEDTISLREVLDRQIELEEEAAVQAERNWGDETRCTYFDGYITQPVFACETCYERSKNENPEAKIEHFGFCYGCCMNCHLEHEVIELFDKHNFRCDCGTPRSKCKCKFDIAEVRKDNNTQNEYGHNYEGLYCYCDGPYSDIEMVMYQCVCCTDWFHLHCIQGQETSTVPDSEVPCDFICSNCTSKHANILSHYTDHLLFPTIEKSTKEEAKEGSTCKLKNSPEKKVEWKNTYWEENWTNFLCKCKDCVHLFEQLHLSHLIEEEEVEEEEKKPKTQKPLTISFEDAINNLQVPHVAKVMVAERFREFGTALIQHVKRAYDEDPGKEAITAEVSNILSILIEKDIQQFKDSFLAHKKQRKQ